MGFLDNSSITVDAILTKHGRKKLARGQGLNISQFALSDDGINYALWNTSHSSGSAYYGEAFTAVPLVEAVPDDSVLMKYKLGNLDRNTLYLPKITLPTVVNNTVTIEDTGADYEKSITPNTQNGTDSAYEFDVQDTSGFDIIPIGSRGGVTKEGHTLRTPPAQLNIATPFTYIASGLTIRALSTRANVETFITITGVDSNSTTYVRLIANANTRRALK